MGRVASAAGTGRGAATQPMPDVWKERRQSQWPGAAATPATRAACVLTLSWTRPAICLRPWSADRIYADSVVARRQRTGCSCPLCALLQKKRTGCSCPLCALLQKRCPASIPPRASLLDTNRACAASRGFCHGLLALLLVPALCCAADDLEKLRDRQDRPGLEKSAAALQAAAEKNPNDAGGWYHAAIAYSYVAEVAMEVRDKNGAQRAAETGAKDADKAIALDAKYADYYRVLGTLCGQVIPANPIMGALAYGKRAKDALDKAIQMDPKSAKAFVAHGVGYYYLPTNFGGGPENAIRDFKQAISLDPKSADAWLWMGIALKKQGKNAEARDAFRKSLELDPDRVWTKEQLDKTPQ
jgi:tetratricopeptide (TPR) repeat protein